MSAHYQYVKLPGRTYPRKVCRDSVYYDPDGWQVEYIGSIHLGFVHGSEHLVVWKDKISKQCFYGEFDTSGMLYDFELSEETKRYDYMPGVQELWVIYPEKLEQMKQFIMGWKPNVWDYDKEERIQLCEALEKVIEKSRWYEENEQS